MGKTILFVESDKNLAVTLGDTLEAQGYHIVEAQNNGEALEKGRLKAMDLILIDVLPPDVDGIAICKRLRAENVVAPIVLMGAEAKSADVVAALKAGGDDFIAKPFDQAELFARIAAHLRRYDSALEQREIKAKKKEEDTPKINLRQGYMIVKGKKVALLQQETKLLEYMYLHEGELVQRETLLDEVWGYEDKVSTRTIDVHVARLRQKMGDSEAPRFLLTVRGIGYKFIAP